MTQGPAQDPAALGVRIRELREAKNRHEATKGDYSLRRFARRLGISFAYLHKIETGKETPSIAMIDTLSRELGADLDDFLSLAGRVPPDIHLNLLAQPQRWNAVRKVLK